jgi:hypothetical protein
MSFSVVQNDKLYSIEYQLADQLTVCCIRLALAVKSGASRAKRFPGSGPSLRRSEPAARPSRGERPGLTKNKETQPMHGRS